MDTKKLAVYLANREADWRDAKGGTKAEAVARARLDGATEALHELGWGMTATQVYHVVMFWVREHPRPVTSAMDAWKTDLKAWTRQVEEELPALLEELDR